MCSILILEPKQMPGRTQLDNAVYNNWHSFGLIIKDGNNLEVIKECPEDEVSPQRVWDLLEQYKNQTRILHLRHNTAGGTTIENTHPFLVFKEGKKEVWWMHNGTFHSYVSRKQVQTTTGYKFEDDPDGKSDSVNFAEQIISPLLHQLVGEHGKGSLKNPLLRKMIMANWSGSNRGVLVSNTEGVMILDAWKQIKIPGTDETFLASNDDYFETVKRGPERERRDHRLKEEAAQKALQERASKGTGTTEIVKLSDYSHLVGVKHPIFGLSTSLKNICDDWDFYDRQGTRMIGYATVDELQELYSRKDACIAAMDFVFTDYALLYDEHEELHGKHTRASKHIAELTKKVEELENALAVLESEAA